MLSLIESMSTVLVLAGQSCESTVAVDAGEGKLVVRGRERQGENAEDIVRGVQLQSREDDVVRDRAKKSLKHVLE